MKEALRNAETRQLMFNRLTWELNVRSHKASVQF